MIVVTDRGVDLYANEVQECMARYFVAQRPEEDHLEEGSGHC